MRGGSLLVLALVSSCGFEAVKEPNPLTNRDLSGADFSGVDFSGVDFAAPPGADLSVPDLAQKLPCAGPLLLVTVENLKNPSTGGGRVVILALGDGSMLPTVCATLSAQGLMTPQPFSAAMVGGKLAVMGRDALQLIDPSSDLVLWSKNAGSQDVPVDVFPLKHPDGRMVVAAGWGSTLTSSPNPIRRVDGWALDGSAIKSWGLNGADLPLGLSVLGMTSHPKTPTHLIALDPINHAWGWDVDPWSASKTAFLGEATGNPVTVFATQWSTLLRTAWVDATSPTQIYYNNDLNGLSISGPITCTGCTLLHAAPDPTINTRFFGLCDGPGVDTRRVVRFWSTSTMCDTVLEGAQYGAQSRLSRLGIGQ